MAHEEIKVLKEEVAALKAANSKLVTEMLDRQDDITQYQWRNCFRFFGVAEDGDWETVKKVLKLFKDTLNNILCEHSALLR